ncbi:MAG: cytochrome P450 [Myxococcales bacterium]|nr:cytochrome P450 [Myxococcales bacterium]
MDDVTELPYDRRPANRDLSHIRGEYGWPFVGKTWDMFKDPQALFGHYYREYGPVSRISITGNKCVLLLHPDHVQRVLMDREKNFSIKMGWQSVMADFFQGGLVMRDYDEHRVHRGIMTSSFKPPAMRAYATKIQSIVEKTVARWATQESILFYQEAKRLLLDIAFQVFCWVDDSESTVPRISRAFTDMMEGALGIVRLDVPGFLYHRGLEGRRYLKRFFMDLIEQKRASNDEDVFAHFCKEKTEDGEYYTDEDIADHMVFLMLAAHDTTTGASTMAAYYLANDQPLQNRLAAEVSSWPRELSFETVFHSVNDLICVFYEAIRLHPPVPVFLRRTIRECEFDGVRVPADTMVCIPGNYIHRLPDWWQDPDAFRPARFSEEVSEHRKHNFMWVPFGGGAHKCIGMHFARMLFLLTFRELIGKYRIEFVEDGYFPAKLQHFPFTRPVDGLPVRLVAR